MLDTHFSTRPVSIRTAVNFSELKISKNPHETLVAFRIGSGIAVSMYDSTVRVGGLLNFILPDSSVVAPERASRFPYMFADTGLMVLLEALIDGGATTDSIQVVIAGGAHILDQTFDFNIGLKNQGAVTSFLHRSHLSVHYEDVGGCARRMLSLDIGSGCNFIQTAGRGEIKI